MDSPQEFFEREIDRTPYSAFNWLLGLSAAILIFGGLGLWHAAGYFKQKQWFISTNVSGATDALLNNAQSEAAAAANSSQDAAKKAAQDQANAAASAATQALLDNAKASITSGASNAAKQAVNSPSPSSSVGGADALQQYLNQ